jgi:hypothetical protein
VAAERALAAVRAGEDDAVAAVVVELRERLRLRPVADPYVPVPETWTVQAGAPVCAFTAAMEPSCWPVYTRFHFGLYVSLRAAITWFVAERIVSNAGPWYFHAIAPVPGSSAAMPVSVCMYMRLFGQQIGRLS